VAENAYFQYFSGETYFQTALPLDRTSMSAWRGRIGPEKLEALALIAETLAAARRAGAVEPSQMRRVTIDTTAQTKAVAHPPTAICSCGAIEWLNRTAKKQGVAVRQSYLRVARHARREVGWLMHVGQRKQAERWVRKLRTWTGRLSMAPQNSPVWRVLAISVGVIGASDFWRPATAFQGRRNGVGGSVRLEAGRVGQEVRVLAQPIAGALDLDDDGMMKQPVEERGRYDGIAVHLWMPHRSTEESLRSGSLTRIILCMADVSRSANGAPGEGPR
jgi:hypothetical protein